MTAIITASIDQLWRENEDLRLRLEEAEETIRAIRAGEVDAVFVESEREQVYTLETAEKPYQLLVAQHPQAAATLRSDGSIIACNRRFAELLQSPLSALRGKPIREFVALESRPLLENMLQNAPSAGAQGTLILHRRDGTVIPIYLGIDALREGALGLCLIATDLTEHRHYKELQQTQAALRESEARLELELADIKQLQRISAQLIQENNIDVLHRQILDGAAAIMRSDFASMQILDPDRGELRLLANLGFDPMAAAFWEWVRTDSGSSCGKALAIGQRVIVADLETCEFVANTDDLQTYRRLGIRAVQTTPLIARGGRPLGMISTHWRLPHEPAERDLRLLDVLARLAADLIERKQTEEALLNADRKKDEFLAMLSHELRSPLAPMLNALQIFKAKSPLDAELEMARGVLDRQIQVMSRLLEDLLDVSRFSQNKLELRKELVEFSSVMEAALETSRPCIEASGHTLTITLPPEPIRLNADPVRLAQVFANLLTNAAKYTETGGRIWLTAERQGDELVVRVKDNGIGINLQVLPRVFELFVQSPRALTRAQGGLGIGLSLVKGLVELHGGSIEARSDGEGKGSEFIVRMPIAQ